MRRVLSAGLCLALAVASPSAMAGDPPVTRREGFLMLWQTIRRAVEDKRETPFEDVPEGSPGFSEITYAKYRGILDDAQSLRPDDPLTVQDALLWLYRTRSVDDIKRLTVSDLPALLFRYPLGDFTERIEVSGKPKTQIINRTVSQQELLGLMQSLDTLLLTEEHEASLYAEKFHGKGTAFGESFDMHALTAAHRTFPYNTLVKVTNVRNGKSVTVRINDRGPYVDGRDMDLSLAAFTSIEERGKGILHATFQRLGDASLVNASACALGEVSRSVRIAGKTHLIGGIPSTFTLGEKLVLHSARSFVVRGIRYPDGNLSAIQDWVIPGESYVFAPSVEGEYVFTLGSRDGRVRTMRTTVVRCSS